MYGYVTIHQIDKLPDLFFFRRYFTPKAETS